MNCGTSNRLLHTPLDSIARVAKYSLIVSAAVSGVLAATPTRARADLGGYYSFDTGDATDSSGNGYHGTVSAANVAFSPVGGATGNGYATFSGVGFGGGYIDVPININTGVLTMGAYVRSSSATGIHTILSHDNGAWDKGIVVDPRPAHQVGGFSYTAFRGEYPGGPIDFAAPYSGTENQWVFVAASFNAATRSMQLTVDDKVYPSLAYFGGGMPFTRIGMNPGFGENWVGDIDNVFFFNEALTPFQVQTLRQNTDIGVLDPGPAIDPSLYLRQTWDFEGSLDGFSVVPGSGTAFNTQPTFGDNPNARGWDPSNMHGGYMLGTYEFRPTAGDPPAGAQGDGPQGIIETAPFVLEPYGVFEFQVGAGPAPFRPGDDPDAPPQDRLAVNLEREVSPGNWEAVFSTSGQYGEVMASGYWDASAYAGETVRLRIYDTASGGWGHVNADYIRYYSAVPEPSTLALVAVGAVGLALHRLRRRPCRG